MTATSANWDDAQDKLGSAFSRSLVLHVAIVGGLAGYAWYNKGEAFGDPNAGGPAVSIESVASIPIPTRGPQNPVANDSEIEAPQEKPEEVKPEPKKPEPEPDDAVALIKKPDTKPKLTPSRPKLKSFDEVASNQLTTKSSQAVSSGMFGGPAGAGQIGMGMNTTLGTRFGAYAALIQDKTRQAWRPQDVEASVKVGPPVTIRFELQRDGRATDIRLTRKSGIPTLDLSVQEAVENAKYPPLPTEYDKSTATVEFTFELRR